MARPESEGTFRRKSRNGSSPPAEAPTPMIGKCGLSAGALRGRGFRVVSFGTARKARAGSCGSVESVDCTSGAIQALNDEKARKSVEDRANPGRPLPRAAHSARAQKSLYAACRGRALRADDGRAGQQGHTGTVRARPDAGETGGDERERDPEHHPKLRTCAWESAQHPKTGADDRRRT